MLADDANVRQHMVAVERLLRIVCDEEELPWFVSDEATLFDVSTVEEAEILRRIATAYGRSVRPHDLRAPLWQLATKLQLSQK